MVTFKMPEFIEADTFELVGCMYRGDEPDYEQVKVAVEAFFADFFAQHPTATPTQAALAMLRHTREHRPSPDAPEKVIEFLRRESADGEVDVVNG